ncbi:MAG: class F sortase [Jatrophihabitantaceae bacterium]
MRGAVAGKAQLARLGALLRTRRGQVGLATLSAVLLAVGLLLVFTGSSGSHRLPPSPPTPQAATAPSTSASVTSSTHRSTAAAAAARCTPPTQSTGTGSTPVHICIKAIGVNSDLLSVGLNADRTMEVPPLSEVGEAAWYRYSPVPGATGPAVVVGHIDSAQYGPGVFFRLSQLHAGDLVSVTRADRMVAEFRVQRVAEYPKSNFPTKTVYGNTSDSELRLITCGGKFDPSAGSYEDNIVAYATLVSLRRA